jgi:predicted nucleotidyltransferase
MGWGLHPQALIAPHLADGSLVELVPGHGARRAAVLAACPRRVIADGRTDPRRRGCIGSRTATAVTIARRRGMTDIRVFGSMSRGEANDNSDVDLLVTLAPGTSALALGGLLLDAQELLGRRVDVVTEPSLHPALRDRVLSDAVLL